MGKRILALAVVLALGVGVGLTIFAVRNHRGAGHANVTGSSTVEFVPTSPPTKPVHRRAAIEWPLFGYDPARRHAPPISDVHPPFRVKWVCGGDELLEFPPAIAYGRLFFANGAGHLIAVSVRTGAIAWDYDSRHGAAASPAVGGYAHGTVYEAFLHRLDGKGDPAHQGEVVAVSTGQGVVRWRRTIGPSETSPLLVGGRVYVGDWLGDVWALDAGSGRVIWTFRTGGAVKGGLAQFGARVFVGSYDGHVYALDAPTGRLIWRTAGVFGTFYSTPAVAYDRVYIGSTDGNVYSFGTSSGALRWSYRTGGYVYGSPAVWHGRVFIGSYDHTFYAFDAATGAVLWRFLADGPISGSGTVINGVVYFATLAGRTYGLDANSGALLWSYQGGKYTPVVADAAHLFLLAHANVYALVPR